MFIVLKLLGAALIAIVTWCFSLRNRGQKHQIDGHLVYVASQKSSSGVATAFDIAVPIDREIGFTFVREESVVRFAKWLRVAEELQVVSGPLTAGACRGRSSRNPYQRC